MSEAYDILVIGGGMAGLTAGRAAAQAGHGTMILIGPVLGGHLVTIEKIDGFPGHADGVPGYELCPTVQMQAAEAGAAFAMEGVQSLEQDGDSWAVATAAARYTARAVILATGTRFRTLGVPGEAEFAGRGVSQCASCDAPLMRNRPVVVVGGGDSACQEALTLVPHVSKITLVTGGGALTAQALYRDAVMAEPKIEIMLKSSVWEIAGDDGVSAVHVRNAHGFDVDIAAHGVFVFTGLQGNSDLVAARLPVDGDGRIAVDGEMRTALPGLLAAGTVRQGTKGRATSAMEDGTTAALAAGRYLNDGAWP